MNRGVTMVSAVTDGGRRWGENRHKVVGNKNMSAEDQARAANEAPRARYFELSSDLSALCS